MDFFLILSIVILFLTGLMSIHSASYARGIEGLAVKHTVWFIAGGALLYLVRFYPVKNLMSLSVLIYTVSVLLLVVVAFFGSTRMGARRWLEIGPFQFQPSEIGKFGLICILARYYSNGRLDWKDPKVYAAGLLLTAIPVIFLLKQPDLGTSVIYFAIYVSALIASGIPGIFVFTAISLLSFVFISAAGAQYFITAAIIFGMLLKKLSFKPSHIVILLFLAFAIGFLSGIVWDNLRPYQQIRLITFMNPEKFSTEGGWQIVQSKAAVSNGGLTGSGYRNGSQTQLGFLPEGHNDFIFSVISEEFGVMGILVVLSAFLLFFHRLVKVVSRAGNRFLYLIGTGIISLFVFQTVLNIYVTLGMLPVTGLTLPLVSYGGTAVLMNMFMIGIVSATGVQEKST